MDQNRPANASGVWHVQLDDGFTWDAATNSVTHVNLEPIDMDKQYQVICMYMYG